MNGRGVPMPRLPQAQDGTEGGGSCRAPSAVDLRLETEGCTLPGDPPEGMMVLGAHLCEGGGGSLLSIAGGGGAEVPKTSLCT